MIYSSVIIEAVYNVHDMKQNKIEKTFRKQHINRGT